jgi:hypothetical protein
MFESAVIRRHALGEKSIEAGIIAETLLFYRNVHIIADQGILTHLLQAKRCRQPTHLIGHKIVTFTFVRSIFVSSQLKQRQ